LLGQQLKIEPPHIKNHNDISYSKPRESNSQAKTAEFQYWLSLVLDLFVHIVDFVFIQCCFLLLFCLVFLISNNILINCYYYLRVRNLPAELFASTRVGKFSLSTKIKINTRQFFNTTIYMHLRNLLRQRYGCRQGGQRGEGPWPLWIFIHGTDIVDRGYFSVFLFFVATP